MKYEALTLNFKEVLPSMKRITSESHEHWLNLIHNEIARLADQNPLPYFEKAFVLIEITTLKPTNNQRLWDTSNRAINLVINNLKGIFFLDDNLEHMAFGVVGKWGYTVGTKVKIMDFNEFIESLEQR